MEKGEILGNTRHNQWCKGTGRLYGVYCVVTREQVCIETTMKPDGEMRLQDKRV